MTCRCAGKKAEGCRVCVGPGLLRREPSANCSFDGLRAGQRHVSCCAGVIVRIGRLWGSFAWARRRTTRTRLQSIYILLLWQYYPILLDDGADAKLDGVATAPRGHGSSTGESREFGRQHALVPKLYHWRVVSLLHERGGQPAGDVAGKGRQPRAGVSLRAT